MSNVFLLSNADEDSLLPTVMSSIEDALVALRDGGMIVVVDDENRENEGDLVMAAEHVDAEAIAFFLRHTSGLICVAATGERVDRLRLPAMVKENTDVRRTAFTVTVDVVGSSTGISAVERARTISALADPATRPDDLVRPGHVHVLRAREGGVLSRAGHTEAGVDLARLAGLVPMSVICELVTHDKLGMARFPELQQFAADHQLPIVSIASLIAHRFASEQFTMEVSNDHDL